MKLNWLKQDYLYYIINQTEKHNIDNIARTKAYQRFFLKHPEIKWALLASIVSRNAGWNMTDLHLPAYQKLLGRKERTRLFMTYERANWLIFSDAYPQLLVYALSVQQGIPLFGLLEELRVSSFMIQEWKRFWKTQDKERLMIALIINEQNVIQQPVIDQMFFKKSVFLSLPYQLQNMFLLNAVLLPTTNGQLYGYYVHGFTDTTNRITLGKKLANQLFHSDIYNHVLDFMLQVEHTGSRYDYERFTSYRFPKSAMLRTVFPIIDHQDTIRKDWAESGGIQAKWWNVQESQPALIGSSFYRKRKMLYIYYHLKGMFS